MVTKKCIRCGRKFGTILGARVCSPCKMERQRFGKPFEQRAYETDLVKKLHGKAYADKWAKAKFGL